MSLVYNFAFAPPAAGETVTITDDSGTEVATATVGSEVGTDGAVMAQVDLAEGGYIGTVEGDFGTWTTRGFLDVPDSIEDTPGASETDGVGAMFFGGADLIALPDNVAVYCPFIAVDDGERNPQRDDLMVIDGVDSTKINVVRSGLYTVSINTPVHVVGLQWSGDPAPGGEVVAKIQFGVNGESEPPAYNFNNRAFWIIDEEDQPCATVALNHTFDQVLLAGDVVRLSFRLAVAGIDETVGGLEMNPDLTMLLTYRGTVPA